MAGQDGDDRVPRMPKDMKGLMNFCLHATKTEDSTGTSHFEQMSEEKKEWLSTALNEMSISPIERLQLCVKTLKEEKETPLGLERKQVAIEEIIEWVEQIDFAIDFHKIGGFRLFLPLINCSNAQLRASCLELIAIVTQNNPYCQKALLQLGYFPFILSHLDDDPDMNVRIKAMLAVSCICRDNEDGLKELVKNNGFSVLMRALQTGVEKLKMKVVFFLANICSDQPTLKDILCDIGMIEQLIGHLSQDHDASHEQVLTALLCIVTDHDRAKAECMRSEFNFSDLLKNRIDMLKDQEQFQEEFENATKLHEMISATDCQYSGER